MDNSSSQIPSTALITGASSGIGAEFANQLAAQGYGLVLVARREDRLKGLASDLEIKFQVPVEVIMADLSQVPHLERVVSRVVELPNLQILVNNAGFGLSGKFEQIDMRIHELAIQLHVLASVRLVHAVLPGMLARGGGSIINVASMAGLIPLRNVTYGATKAYLVHFSRTLHQELLGSGVRVQALCPGFVYTEFHSSRPAPRSPRFMWSTAEKVVSASLATLERDRVICVPGRIYRLIAALGTSPLIFPLISSAARLILPRRPS